MKKQGQCGVLHVVSTAADSLEGAWVSQHEQQFVDCDTRNSSCNRALGAQRFVRLPRNTASAQKGAIRTPQDVARESRESVCPSSWWHCRFQGHEQRQRSVSDVGFRGEAADSERPPMPALSEQPVTIAIEADPFSFLMYPTGVLTAPYGTKRDYGGLSFGYGTVSDKDHWKAKPKSWNSTWSEQGFTRLQCVKSGAGECGLLSGPPSCRLQQRVRPTLSVIDVESFWKVVLFLEFTLNSSPRSFSWLTGMTSDGVNDALALAVAAHTAGHGEEPERGRYHRQDAVFVQAGRAG